ncbi:MAG: Alginate biosynthesis protein AlgA [Candidatus Anoxychlamydiales bacterium]|nr:Alginate biosynthesis protein AlgA [Candidatus Anoxychlamydiales bacterium]
MKENIVNKIYKRPWGTYQSLKIEKTCQVKWIEIKPNSKLSLQKHKQRSEHWIVVKGKPLITVDKMKKTFNENEHVFIPKEGIHRIENDTDQMAIIVEVQIGNYLGEDDIIRLEDVYGRT